MDSILADATAFADFVPFSKVLKLDCLFPTHVCAEAFILQWIDTAWNLFFFLFMLLRRTPQKAKIAHYFGKYIIELLNLEDGFSKIIYNASLITCV